MAECKILVQRKIFNTSNIRNCIGELFLNDIWFAYTLEDEVRAINNKVYAKTAIPAGNYSVKVVFSPKFKKELPLIYNDNKDFSVKKGKISWYGILFHGGNIEEHSAGCLLIGKETDGKKIWGNITNEFVGELKKYDKISLKIENRIFANGLTKQIETY